MALPILIDTVDYQKCAAMAGNKFDMILIAALRVRELKRGYAKTIVTTCGNIVTSLQEIEAGNIGREYLKKIR